MDRKNILLISFDDAVAPWPYKSAFGEALQTPNLDRLCAVSTAFHSAYAQAPICGPSRASMMTMMMPPELGMLDNATYVFDKHPPQLGFSHALKAAGLFCSSGGKVHHRYKPLIPVHHRMLYSDQRKGFGDDMSVPEELKRRSLKFGGFRNGLGTPDGEHDDSFYDAQSATSVISFLNDYDRDQPFYREVGFFSPHVPHITPARFKRLYKPRRLRRPADWADYRADNPYAAKSFPEREDIQADGFWQRSVRNYFSAYTHGDHHLGRVLDALAASRHAASTVVIVVSDHGFHLGNRNLFRKTTLWEQSLHVPIIVHDPSDPVGRVVNDPVGLIDLGPTIMDYAGVDPPALRHGRSLRPYLDGARDPDRVIPSFYKGNASVRKGRYRVIRYGDGSLQLFDCVEDYWQLRDLGPDHPAFAGMLDALGQAAFSCGFDLSRTESPDVPEAAETDSGPATVVARAAKAGDEDADATDPDR
jgi:arylsulfatase A-like enzyme